MCPLGVEIIPFLRIFAADETEIQFKGENPAV